MSFISDHLQDVLIFISGFIFLIIAIIFLQLYFRYRRRDYFLLSMGFIAATVSSIAGELDAIIGESVTTEFLDLLSAIFTFIMVSFILVVLVYPHKVPIDFEEKLTVIEQEE